MKSFANGLAVLLLLLLKIFVAAQTQTNTELKRPSIPGSIDCSGTVRACGRPVKFLTKTGSCICYTCAYGTADAKQLCTKSVKEVKAFAKLVNESGLADDAMETAVAEVTGETFNEPTNRRRLEIPNPVEIDGQKLATGDYSLHWDGTGPAVQVSIMKGNKVIAMVPATVIDLGQKATVDTTVVKTKPDGTKSLAAVQFGGKRQALEFDGFSGGMQAGGPK